jgi:dihydrofolate reductase
MNISIDGCYDHTKFTGGEDILEYFNRLMQDVDTSLSGRKMHELMHPYWDNVTKNQSGTPAANKYAQTVARIQKIVISCTLNNVAPEIRLIRDDPAGELLRLKQLPGKRISIGGVSLRGQLTALGLIDEYFMVVHPVIVGRVSVCLMIYCCPKNWI